jgi:hypothetical protein
VSVVKVLSLPAIPSPFDEFRLNGSHVYLLIFQRLQEAFRACVLGGLPRCRQTELNTNTSPADSHRRNCTTAVLDQSDELTQEQSGARLKPSPKLVVAHCYPSCETSTSQCMCVSTHLADKPGTQSLLGDVHRSDPLPNTDEVLRRASTRMRLA